MPVFLSLHLWFLQLPPLSLLTRVTLTLTSITAIHTEVARFALSQVRVEQQLLVKTWNLPRLFPPHRQQVSHVLKTSNVLCPVWDPRRNYRGKKWQRGQLLCKWPQKSKHVMSSTGTCQHQMTGEVELVESNQAWQRGSKLTRWTNLTEHVKSQHSIRPAFVPRRPRGGGGSRVWTSVMCSQLLPQSTGFSKDWNQMEGFLHPVSLKNKKSSFSLEASFRMCFSLCYFMQGISTFERARVVQQQIPELILTLYANFAPLFASICPWWRQLHPRASWRNARRYLILCLLVQICITAAFLSSVIQNNKITRCYWCSLW